MARGGRSRGDPRRPAGLLGRPGGLPARRACGRSDAAHRRAGIPARAGDRAMSTELAERPVRAGGHGGLPARRAVLRWAWRMFRREWRQQLLMLALITVAVGATVVGAAVAADTPPPAGAGFGTANHLATFGGGPRLAGQIASLRDRFGPVDVIENQTLCIPGSIQTYHLRAPGPHG